MTERAGASAGVDQSPRPGSVASQPAPTSGGATAARPRRQPLKLILVLVGVLGIVLATVAWAFASPLGGAPDDDYHLPSIWCPMPLESSGCTVVPSGNSVRVMVPETVGKAAECYKFRAAESAHCQANLVDEQYIYTSRVDKGEYPRGYYQFQHLLVGENVTKSALTMRVVNVALAAVGLIAVGALASRTERRNLVLAVLGSWVPLGLYLIASNNPSTWAISGVMIFGAALLSATTAKGWRAWALMGVAVYGAVLACTSRTDATIYCIIVAIAIFLLRPIGRAQLKLVALGLATSVAALAVFFSVGQSSTFTAVGDGRNAPGFNQLLFDNLIRLPQYLTGFWGMSTGFGWLDVHLYPIAGVACFIVGASLFMLCLGEMSVRKLLAAGMLFGAIVSIPLAVTLANRQFLVDYQPRYLLPLLGVFFLVALTTSDGAPIKIGRWQLWAGVALLSIGNSLALHTSIRRYVTGLDLLGFGLNQQAEWWWSFGLSPMGLWAAGSLAFLVGAIALAVLVRHYWTAPAAALTP